MSAEQYLIQVGKLDELINAKIAERDRLVALATNITASPMDGMPHSNTGTVSQKMQDAVVNLIMVEQELTKLIDQYVEYKKQVVSTLEKLPANEYGVLHRFYIRYMTLEQIAEEMGYCKQQIWRIKKKGLNNLENVIECYHIKCYNAIVK